MGTRRIGREYALQILYFAEMGSIPSEEVPAQIILWDAQPGSQDTLEFADSLVRGVWAQAALIDGIIQEQAKNWKISRMSAIDRCILRIAVYELTATDTPFAAVIDEAIELAKRFSTDNSGAFINGLLDHIKDKKPAP